MFNKSVWSSVVKVGVIALAGLALSACDDTTTTTRSMEDEINTTQQVTRNLVTSQPTPTDINYSLERYNLIKRAYWVNGEREKALALETPIVRPMGYIVLMSGNAVVQEFTVDGKVSSLNSFLTPDSEYYEYYGGEFSNKNDWLADVDGSFGSNDEGIFFFTTEGNYIEWTGDYIYSDIPMHIDNPVVNVKNTQ